MARRKVEDKKRAGPIDRSGGNFSGEQHPCARERCAAGRSGAILHPSRGICTFVLDN